MSSVEDIRKEYQAPRTTWLSRQFGSVDVRRPEKYAASLAEMLEQGQQIKMEGMLARFHPADIAEILLLLPVQSNRDIIQTLYKLRKAGLVISELPRTTQIEILEGLSPEIIAELARRLDTDDAVDILRGLPEETLDTVLAVLQIDEVTELERLMLYKENTAGGMMSTEVFTLSPDLSVAEAVDRLALASEALEGAADVLISDEWQRLLGKVDLRSMLFARREQLLAELLEPNVITVRPDRNEEEVARIMAKYDLLTVPVVDESERLLGIITIDDVVDVIQEAATEDVYRMAGLDESDRVFSTPARSIRMRLPWLAANLLTASLSGFIVNSFQHIIGQVLILASLMPMVSALGGNAGTQTVTVIVRGFALGELHAAQAVRAVGKELTVGLVIGLCLGLMSGLLIFLIQGSWVLGAVFCVALVLNILLGTSVGSMLPLVLKSLRLDPAIASTILVTAITDIGGFWVFLGLAQWAIPWLNQMQ